MTTLGELLAKNSYSHSHSYSHSSVVMQGPMSTVAEQKKVGSSWRKSQVQLTYLPKMHQFMYSLKGDLFIGSLKPVTFVVCVSTTWMKRAKQ